MKNAIFLLAIFLLPACNGGTWVDTVGPSCENGELSKNIINDQINEIAKGTCMASGKAFTGDVQCKGNDVQVKCK